MRLNLRLTLTVIFSSLVALLVVGIAASFILGARLQREVDALHLDEHAALERGLLQRLGMSLAAPPGSDHAADQHSLQHLLDDASAAAADLRLQGAQPGALALAAALDDLAIVAGAGDSTRLAAAEAAFAAALDAYSAEAARAAETVYADLDLQGPSTLFVIGSLLIAGLALVLMLSQLSGTLLRPLQQIGAALDAVGAGNLATPMPARVPGELAPLVAAYSQMTAALRERQRSIDAQLRRTSLLTQLSIELREPPETETIAERVLRSVGVTLGLDEATLILTGSQGTAAAYIWRSGGVLPLEAERAEELLSAGVEGWVQHVGSPTVIADVGASKRWRAGSPHKHGSAIVLPIRQGASTLGILTIYTRRAAAFDNHDLLLMESVVAQAGVALSAALRYQEERLRNRQALALLTMSQMLTVERTRDELAAALDELSRSVFQADYGLLYLNRPDGTPTLIPPAHTPVPELLSGAARVNAEDAATTAGASGQIVTLGARPDQPAHTCLALPLVHAGQPIGACVLVRETGGEAAFPAGLWSLLTVFTNIIASACANIELIEQLRRYAGQLEGLVEQHTEELRRSRDLLRIVFDNLPEGLLLIDADGTLLAANNAFCRGIVGRLPRHIVGRDYRALWNDIAGHDELNLKPQGPSESGAPLLPPEGEGFHRKPASWRVLGTDLVGQQRWYSVDRIPVVGLRGELDQYLERWRDITHQEELQRRLLLHEQMTSLGRLAASIAHEVGNPLQSAMGCLELCREDGNLNELAREYLELALGELDRMSRTMDSLRSLYRPPQINWELVQLNQIVRQVALFTQRQLDKARIRLELDLDENLPAIIAQPDALRQVFLNLALNAQEAMPGGGSIRIHTCRKDTDRMCQVTITDTGLGMSEEQQEHLFEPFRSGKAQGVGLGLYLSKQIIDQHTGHIEVASHKGHGTTITVLLPWSDAGPARAREPLADEVGEMEGQR
jgi:signal transduction histidine kinase/nitrate/nitrite-specific signal transduction histidine kinase